MPPITKNLLLINILMYMAYVVAQQSGVDLNDLLGLHFFKSHSFHFYQLVSYMFMHANLQHIFFNMLALWMFGRIIEQSWGAKRYLIFYMVCGIGAGLCQEAVQYLQYVSEGLGQYQFVDFGGGIRMPMEDYLAQWTTVGASGAIYGILLGFGLTYPNATIMLLIPPLPLKAKWLVVGYAVIELWAGLTSTGSNVAHFAHLGTTVGASGAIYGILLGFGLTYPNATIMLLIPPLPLKAKWLVVGYAVIELWAGLTSTGSNVAHFAHLGGMLFGLALIMYWRHKNVIGSNGFTAWKEYKPRDKRGRKWNIFGGKGRQRGEDRDIGPDPHYTSYNNEANSAERYGHGGGHSAHNGAAHTDPAAQRRAKQEEVDRILDKVRRSGYSCLTDEEKKTLFDFRNK